MFHSSAAARRRSDIGPAFGEARLAMTRSSCVKDESDDDDRTDPSILGTSRDNFLDGCAFCNVTVQETDVFGPAHETTQLPTLRARRGSRGRRHQPHNLQAAEARSTILPGGWTPVPCSKASRARASGNTSAITGFNFPSSTSVEI